VQKPDDSDKNKGVLNKDFLGIKPDMWTNGDLKADVGGLYYSISFEGNNLFKIQKTCKNNLSVLPIPLGKKTEEEDYSKMALARSLIEDGGIEDSNYLAFWDIPGDRSIFEFEKVND